MLNWTQYCCTPVLSTKGSIILDVHFDVNVVINFHTIFICMNQFRDIQCLVRNNPFVSLELFSKARNLY